MVRLAEASGRFDQSVEHCFEIESGAADDLKHVGGGRLLPQRLGQFAGSLFELLSYLAHATKQPHMVGVAKSGRRLGQRIEHGLQIEGRAADDLEHVGGGRLLLQRFGQIVCALAQLVEQARVLDGDDGLAGEV